MKENYNTIKEAVAAAYAALERAEEIALETGQGFSFSPVYGMGGYFDPEEIDEDTDSHWYPSSMGC